MNSNLKFEDGVLTCLDIVDRAESREEAYEKIMQLIESYNVVVHEKRVELIKDELGLWGVL